MKCLLNIYVIKVFHKKYTIFFFFFLFFIYLIIDKKLED